MKMYQEILDQYEKSKWLDNVKSKSGDSTERKREYWTLRDYDGSPIASMMALSEDQHLVYHIHDLKRYEQYMEALYEKNHL